MDNFRKWISLCESVEPVVESSPPNKKAKHFIKKHKKEFTERYGKRGDQVLYATAWKRFREGVTLQEYLTVVENVQRRNKSATDLPGHYTYDHSSAEILSGPHASHDDAMDKLHDIVQRPQIPPNFGVVHHRGLGKWT